MLLVALAGCLGATGPVASGQHVNAAASDQDANAYDFSFTAIDGGSLPLSQFRGQALLVVNTASFCGFTRQYAGIQGLWQRYRDRGLVVVGVPSNDFGGQEPGTDAEVKEFCEANFAIDFPLTSKVRVVGPEAHPFYRWAAAASGGQAAPRWNFHKLLIAPDGSIAGWFPSLAAPGSAPVVAAIEANLPAQ